VKDEFCSLCGGLRLPYFSEPDLFYWYRMKVGLRVKELRQAACRFFRKPNDQLTVRDLKLAFLKMHPMQVNLGGMTMR